MKKIPLEATLAGAYRFLFTNIVSIVGTIWFPSVLLLGLTAGLVYLVVPHQWFAGDFSHFDPSIFWSPAVTLARALQFVAAIIVGPMILVGLMRHALGLKKTTTFIYFSLGAPVWRMLGAIVLGVVVYIVAVLLICALGALVAIFAGPMIPPAYHGYAVAGGIAVCVVFGLFLFYAAFRLFFFLPAVVVAEECIGLGRSWSLGGGNFWRMFVVYLLVTIPAGFVFGVALEMTILPTVMAEMTKLHAKPEAKEVLVFLHQLLPLLPAVIGIAVIYGIAVRGLVVGAIANAYKGVTEVPKSATPAAAAVPPAMPVVPPEVAPLVPDAPKELSAPAEATSKEATDATPPTTSSPDSPPTESAPKIPDAPN